MCDYKLSAHYRIYYVSEFLQSCSSTLFVLFTENVINSSDVTFYLYPFQSRKCSPPTRSESIPVQPFHFTSIKRSFKIEGGSSLSYLHPSPVILLSFTHFAFLSSFSVEKVKQFSSLLFRLHIVTYRAAPYVIVYDN